MGAQEIVQYIILAVKWILLVMICWKSYSAYNIVTKQGCGDIVLSAIKTPMLLVLVFNAMMVSGSTLESLGMVPRPKPVIVKVAVPAPAPSESDSEASSETPSEVSSEVSSEASSE
jgi:hypothetical protein